MSLYLFEIEGGGGEICLFPSSFFQVSRIISSLEEFFISAGIPNKTFRGFAPKLQLCWLDPNQRLVKKAPSAKREILLPTTIVRLEFCQFSSRLLIGAGILMGKCCLII